MSQIRSLRYPDFVCIGAQKSATTWLHAQIGQHPEIWLPPLKEIHYFDVVQSRRERKGVLKDISNSCVAGALRAIRRSLEGPEGDDTATLQQIHLLSLIGLRGLTDDWYGKIFAAAPENSKCGEITPEYALLDDEAIAHLVGLNPKVRILFILRDPIERGWSALRMMKKRTGHSRGWQNAMDQPKFLAMADYAGTIERYRKHVVASNFLVLHYEDVVARPLELLDQVCGFLGVPFDRVPFSSAPNRVAQGPESKLEPALYENMRAILAPAYRNLMDLDDPIAHGWYRKHFDQEGSIRGGLKSLSLAA